MSFPIEESPILEALSRLEQVEILEGIYLIPSQHSQSSHSPQEGYRGFCQAKGCCQSLSGHGQTGQALSNTIGASVSNSIIVDRLNEIRAESEPHQPNRIDTTLADIFSLLSLFFLTIGRTKECPATYSQVASIRVSSFPSFALGTLTAGEGVICRKLALPASRWFS